MARSKPRRIGRRDGLGVLSLPGCSASSAEKLTSALAQARVNLLLVSGQFLEGPDLVHAGLSPNPDPVGLEPAPFFRQGELGKNATMSLRMALVTVFPYDGCLTLPLDILECLFTQKLPFHTLGTSPGAVALMVRERLAVQAAETLAGLWGIPPHLAAPINKPKTPAALARLMGDRETTCDFQEHPIRTYCALPQENCWVMSLTCSRGRISALRHAARQHSPQIRLLFFTAAGQGDSARLTACFSHQEALLARNMLAQANLPEVQLHRASLYQLQGPHFGDRPGILAAALKALARAGVKPLGFAGAVHTLYLAIPPAGMRPAAEELSREFCGPREDHV